MRHLQIYEHQKLTITSKGFFQRKHFEALTKYNEIHGEKYFTILHNGIKTKQYVGVITVGDLSIEILPKADKSRKSDATVWQKVLLEMLKTCGHLKITALSKSMLRLQQHTFLDLYFETYLEELEQIVRKGLVKKYHSSEGNKKALKGQLLLHQHIVKNSIHKERFYVRHNTYSTEHLLHQILKKALFIVLPIIKKSNLQVKAQSLATTFSKYQDISVTEKDFDRLRWNRKTLAYEKVIEMAKLIILNYSPDIRQGSHHVLAILFDMNQLFEGYIFKKLKRLEKTHDLKVHAQMQTKFWNNKVVRPDIMLSFKDKQYIIDTKWKILKTNKPNDNDLKQMYVYNHYFEAQKSILLYPKVAADQNDLVGYYHKTNFQDTIDYRCDLAFAKVIVNGKLNPTIGEEILETLV